MSLSEFVLAHAGSSLETELERLHGAATLRRELRLDEPAAGLGVTEQLRDAILLAAAGRRLELDYHEDHDEYYAFLTQMMRGRRGRMLQSRLGRDHEDRRLLAYATYLILEELVAVARQARKDEAFGREDRLRDVPTAALDLLSDRVSERGGMPRELLRALAHQEKLSFLADVPHLLAVLQHVLPKDSDERTVLAVLLELSEELVRPLDEVEAGVRVVDRCRDEARRDLSGLVITDFLLVMIEFHERVNDPAFALGWAYRDLIRECLKSPVPVERSPRRLRTVFVEGELLKLPDGDRDELRGLTTLTHEDQLPEVIPEEMAPWCLGSVQPDRAETGRYATLHHLVNEEPLIFEYSNMRKPIVRHRTLLVFLVDLERTKLPADVRPAELVGGRLAFELLVTAGLVTPHDLLETEVAFFQCRRGGDWAGRRFPLRSLKLTTRNSEGWRNLVAVDSCLPEFFVTDELGGRACPNRLIQDLPGEPDHHLRRLCESGRFHSLCTVVVARRGKEERALARETLLAPMAARAPWAVLLCQASDGDADFRSGAFPDLAAAREHRLRTKGAKRKEVLEAFATMLIGAPKKRRRS